MSDRITKSHPWPVWLRSIISAWLVLHVLAMIAGPAASPPPSSELSRAIAYVLMPYLHAFSLDNGYRFFAPDPGPSHLVRYELVDAQDAIIATGDFPNRKVHWPRLWYHRHFMVAEMMHSQFAPALDIPPIDQLSPQERKDSEILKQQALRLPRNVASYLLRQTPEAVKVRLYLREHLIPSPFDLARGVKLEDPEWIREILVGEFSRESDGG